MTVDIENIPEAPPVTQIDDDVAALVEAVEKEAEAATPDAAVPAKPGGYLRNRDLLPAIREARELGYMTDKLARMLLMLCGRYGTHYLYSGYSYNDDMQSYAMLMLVRSWASFNPDRSNNPFAYYTQCIKNSFKQYLNYEKRQRKAKDEMLIRQGYSPSNGYTGDDDGNKSSDDIVHQPSDSSPDVDDDKEVAPSPLLDPTTED